MPLDDTTPEELRAHFAKGRQKVQEWAAKEKAKAKRLQEANELHQQAMGRLIEASTDPQQARPGRIRNDTRRFS